ncbi:hypothetical protein XJ44_08460 [Thermosipho affectus]|uniref:Uncharacterized protein n=1 Tax=Thermosipho affectus TaxID=660294 RepID=A0ABX3IF91_9BACT|nr:hypothetical protein [Thermosipho affectus]ONN26489.1 hypothetical protein XJ44_08460 [Thermosipho affectus]
MMKVKILNPIIPPEDLETENGCEMIAQLCEGGSGPCGPAPGGCFFDLPIECTWDNPNVP